jgi:hypothetical protein
MLGDNGGQETSTAGLQTLFVEVAEGDASIHIQCCHCN